MKLKSISLHLCKLANVGVTSAGKKKNWHIWCAFIKSWIGSERSCGEPVTLAVSPKATVELSLLPPFRSSLLHFYTMFEVTCQQQFDEFAQCSEVYGGIRKVIRVWASHPGFKIKTCVSSSVHDPLWLYAFSVMLGILLYLLAEKLTFLPSLVSERRQTFKKLFLLNLRWFMRKMTMPFR